LIDLIFLIIRNIIKKTNTYEDKGVLVSEKPLVLIIDDTATNIAILSACLENNYQLKTASNGEQGIEIAKQSPKPDLILLDIEMPGTSGYEVCQQLKTDPKTADISIIFVTAKLGVKGEEKGFSLGAVDYITKPIHPPIVAARVKTHVTLKRQKDKLEKMALYDQLTGLHNRHFLLNSARLKISAAIRHKFPVSVMMIDIDHFKSINDNYGHPAGDSVIKAVAKTLNKECRTDDIASRFGGEEFVLILCHCDISSAFVKAEKMRTLIEGLKPLGIKTTVSVGLSEIEREEDSFTDLLDRADKALYQAKEQGRNQTVSLLLT